MGLRWGLLVSVLLLCPSIFISQTKPDSLHIVAVRVHGSIGVDGILSESEWQRPGFTSFTQRLPNEGVAPSQKTEVWLAYDDEALYVAARMYDTAPDSIIKILGRRDVDLTADWFQFDIDPYHDRRSGFYFALSAAGTMQDGTLYNDEWNDNSWDGVWEGKAHIDEQGWTAEMRIPYTQLRFHQAKEYVWGVDFSRMIGRKSETDFVVFTPQKGSGFVSRFIDADGIDNIYPPNDFEILPYVTSRAEFAPHAAGDPFNNGSKYLSGLGGDLKIALGPDLTLNGTVNPDFGQVEVDPAVVNLSDVETYYQEKRPFFVEGANTFNFGQGGSNNFWGFNWAGPTFFYSRRIGRNPQGSLPSYDYADLPLGTHIIGAGKLTGKIGDNWNIGMIHAVTNREFAKMQSSGVRQSVEVEPLTYYGVARIQKDFDDGRQGIGILTTYTNRFFDNQSLKDQINGAALVSGLDGWQFLDSDKTYVLTGWGAVSRITGDNTQITALQENSRHYFQRPGASDVHLDTNATVLNGYAARFALNKQKGSWMLNSAIGFINPGFDVDDLGYMGRTDMINYHFVGGYKWTDPTDYYHNERFNVSIFGTYDYAGNKTWQGYWTSNTIEFTNFYQLQLSYAYNPYSMDIRGTRGGPAVLNPTGWELDWYSSSDSRKAITLNLYGYTYQGGGGSQFQSELDVDFKPSPNVEVTIGPNFNRNLFQAQWVGSYVDAMALATYGSRYIFADIDQKTLSANIRLNWTFTPQLSLQIFAQPLISSGAYSGFKAFAQPRTFNFTRYGDGGSSITKSVSSMGAVTYTVDADGSGPAPSYDFSNPDFNFTSLRGNAVLRWEFKQGSIVYLVWTQSRSDNENFGDFQFDHSLNRLVTTQPDNIFMVKFTYWWSM
jgi:hypothetical protein